MAGVVTQDVYDALTAMRQERGIPTTSKAVGEALREWTQGRASKSFKPLAAREGDARAFESGSGLKPTDIREMTLQPWQEIRGLVREVAEDGPQVRIVLEDKGDAVVVIRRPGPPQGLPIAVGMNVSILRTDEPGREYIVRTLD